MNKKKNGYATESASEDETENFKIEETTIKKKPKKKKPAVKELVPQTFDFASTFNFDANCVPKKNVVSPKEFFFDFVAAKEITLQTATGTETKKETEPLFTIPDFTSFKPFTITTENSEWVKFKNEMEEKIKANERFTTDELFKFQTKIEETKLEFAEVKSFNEVFCEQLTQSTTYKLDELKTKLMMLGNAESIQSNGINKQSLIHQMCHLSCADLNSKLHCFLNDSNTSDAKIADLQLAVDLIVTTLNIMPFSSSHSLIKKSSTLKKMYCEFSFLFLGFVCFCGWIVTIAMNSNERII